MTKIATKEQKRRYRAIRKGVQTRRAISSRRLIEVTGRGEVKASDNLFQT